jgi:hypothetical protein
MLGIITICARIMFKFCWCVGDVWMPKIFISYARADAIELAEELADRLRAMEYDVFLDKHTMVGSIDWEKEIKARARWCDVMLILVTPAANQSGWVYREFEFARAAKNNILPVIVDKTPLPVHLGMYQAIEYTNNLDSVLLQIARIVPPPLSIKSERVGCSRIPVSFGVIATVLSLMLAFLAIVPEETRARWFCPVTNSCPTEIAAFLTNTPEPTITNEPTPLSSTPTPIPPTPSHTPEPTATITDEPTPIPPTSSNTPEPPPSETPLPTLTPTPILFYTEDFDSGEATGWLLTGSWQVLRGGSNQFLYLAQQVGNYTRARYIPSEDWENVSIEFEVQVQDYLHVYFCKSTSSQNYVLNINQLADYVSLYDYARSRAEPTKVEIALLGIGIGEYNVRIDVQEQQVTVTVDSIKLDTITIPQCAYGIEFGFGAEDPVRIDDIRVWSLDDSE